MFFSNKQSIYLLYICQHIPMIFFHQQTYTCIQSSHYISSLISINETNPPTLLFVQLNYDLKTYTKYNRRSVQIILSLESWIIVAANPLRWKLSEWIYFHRRVCSFCRRTLIFTGEFVVSVGELLVSIGENQHFSRVSFQIGISLFKEVT